MKHHHKPCGCPVKSHCGCTKPANEVVHPVKKDVVHKCTEETVKHIHPSHTTVMNHHLVKNEHVFPHSTSFENTFNEVDVVGGSFNTPPSGGAVGGAMSPGMGHGAMGGHMGGHHMGCHKGHHHHGAGMHNCNKHKPKKWC